MGYADGLLSTNERIVHRAKQHWWVFIWGARYTILAVVIAAILFWLGGRLAPDGAPGTLRMVLGWATAALFIGGIVVLIWTTLRYFSQEYVLTNRRVIQVSGVINKTSADSSLEKINDAVLTQSIFGRMFGFGDLKILTASEAAISEFRMLIKPVDFKKAMLDAKHEYEREVAGGAYATTPPLRAETAAGGTPGDTVAEAPAAPGSADETTAQAVAMDVTDMSPDELTRTLSSLADLRDRGAISAEDYERKKADILARL